MQRQPPATLTGLSSKATQHLLADLAERFAHSSGISLQFESAGGVDVARRVRAGEYADILILADDAMTELSQDGLVAADTVRPLFVSQVVLAVSQAMSAPALQTEEDLLAVLRSAESVAYSTGPSGTALVQWLARRDPSGRLFDRLTQAPPGVPVGALIADGAADVGIQQLSELNRVSGVLVVGPLPGDAAVTSTFTAGLLGQEPSAAARQALAFLGSQEHAQLVREHGMRVVD